MKGVGAICVMYELLFTLFTLLQITYASIWDEPFQRGIKRPINLTNEYPRIYQKVFIYDIHKRGEPLHNFMRQRLNGEAKFIQEGHTVTRYPLVVFEDQAYLLNKPGIGHNVIGEVYDVDNAMAGSLRVLHMYPIVFYESVASIQLKNATANDKPIQCLIHFYNGTDPDVSNQSMISEYHAKGNYKLVRPTTYSLVFLYDHHKRGEPSHHILLDEDYGEATFIQEGHTVKRYPLVVFEDNGFLLNNPGKGHNVIGEVFKVDDAMFGSLIVEYGFPLFYYRRLVRIQLKNATANDKPIECWTYFYNGSDPNVLKQPMISEYHSKAPVLDNPLNSILYHDYR